jgi:multidrug transporter EmrE-like cation transporter
MGIPNFFSAKFMLASLTQLPAVVVYPSFSVATMLIVTLTGVVAFRERLSKLQWAALSAIIVALVLLNI